MDRCYDSNNNTDACVVDPGPINDDLTSFGGHFFLGHTLSEVIICPAYILAILLPIQLLAYLMSKDTKRQNRPLGKLTTLNIALTLLLAFLLSWKMTLENNGNLPTDFKLSTQFFSSRTQIVTYILVAFLTLVEKTRLLNLTLTFLMFWSSTLTTLSVTFYNDLQDEALDKKSTTFWIDVAHISIVVLQCFLLYLKNSASRSERDADVLTHPQDKSSWLSDFTLFWTLDLIKTGAKRELQESDVYDLAPRDKCRQAVTKFERNLKIEELVRSLNNEHGHLIEQGEEKTGIDCLLKEEKGNVESARISILSVLLKTYGVKYFTFQIGKALLELSGFIHPVLMGVFMNHISNREHEHWTRGFGIVCFIFAMDVLIHLSHHRHWGSVLRFGKQLKASIILAVFKKALAVKNEANKDLTTGEIVNLISDDCDRVVNLSQELFHLIATPMQVGISMYLLYNLVGTAMFVGLFIMILLIPLNKYVGGKMKSLHKERDEAKEKRTKLMNEIIHGIKVLKLYAWEKSFMEKVQEIRAKEEQCNNSISLLSACIDSMFRAIPFLVKVCSFGMYILLGGQLDPTTGFITMHLFHHLNHPFSLMPLLIPGYVEAAASLKRIEKFMNGENIPTDNVVRKKKTLSNSAISISDGEFTWERSRETNTLRNINVDIPKGSLVAVVGMVGTGKSSLLSAMLGEMEKVKGHVEVQGQIAYVPQEAWIINAPLKDNVLFGSSMDTARYKRVVDACALKHDIDVMKAGDKTEIGEKGINLSGGQKQRVSLARALYNDADVFLFDDPLSAVDAHVGKHIFNKVISDTGLLQGKTRVLVTHGLHWLQRVDSIIVLKDGEISEAGTYEQLVKHDGPFAQFLRNSLPSSSQNSNSKLHKATKRTLSRLDSLNNNNPNNDSDIQSSPDNTSSDSCSTDSSGDDDEEAKVSNNAEETNDDKDGTLIDDEELEQGQVDKKIYLEYIKAIGYKTVTLFVILAFITSVFDSYNNLTLKQWTDDPVLNNESLSDTVEYNNIKWNHFMLFGVSGAIEVIAAFLFVLTILSQAFQAATRLHNNLLFRILRCPMSFFDTTPSCRILIRFSKDVSRVDGLGGCLRGLVICVSNMLIFLAMIIINSPAVTYYLVPITIAYFFLFKYHIGTIRQLRRFRSKYRSPMYTHFTETLNGLSSIRAYACQNRFVQKMENLIDEFVKYDLLEHWASLGLGIRSGFLYHMIVFVSGLVCVMDSSMTAGMVGLTVLFASNFTGTMNGFFWTVTHAETEIIALEKLIEYSNKPSEAEWDIEETKPVHDWPKNGHVTFNSYKARYRDGLDLVLKGVDCQIQNGEKVGIVGRTGAGKTSLTMAFFRLLEAAEGEITVDDENISDLGLHNLRSRINILPQEPVIFSGTLKMNLDPFGKHSDEEIWTALKRSHLEPFIRTLPKELDFECGEGGKNLSVGQRQLLCLARTLLRKTKILVLDEATAAVDMETDELIQKTIRSEFKDCTVLTIAHRLNTILDYDKIMVLEFGKVKEFDKPSTLLADENSTFHSMAKDAKLV